MLLVTVVGVGVLLLGLAVVNQDISPVINIILAMATIVLLGLFETLRKRGDAIFQELSDELQWHVGRGGDRDFGPSPEERPMLEARVALRSFAAAADLPLVPGRFGGAIYAALNLGIAVASVLLSRS